MAWVWTAVGTPGLVAFVLGAAAALVVLFARPDRRQNRLLATVLGLEAVGMGAGGGLMWLTDSPADSYGWQAVTIVCALPLPLVYLAFLGTLRGALAAPFRSAGAMRVLLACAAAAPLLWFARPDAFVGATVPWTHAPWTVEVRAAFAMVILANGFGFVYGLATALVALRAARSSAERAQARAFALAFGVRDAGLGAVFVGVGLGLVDPNALLFAVLPPAIAILYIPLLAYGTLRTQLFDIDLRIKRTISRGTVVAAFASVFFVVGVVAESFLSERYGYLVGGAAAGLLLLGLQPLQRLGGRLADSAMPNVQETPAYLAFRKLEVYKAALEGAMQDGEVTPKEREMLRRLRASLAIAEADAAAMERDLGPVARTAGVGRSPES